MSGYWLYNWRTKIILLTKRNRSDFITGRPDWWTRFICWLLLGWKWQDR